MNDISSKPSPNGYSTIHYLSDPKRGGLNNSSPAPNPPSRSKRRFEDNPLGGVAIGVVLSVPLWWLILLAIRWLVRN